MNEKLVSIIGMVLGLVAIILSIIVLINVAGLNKKVDILVGEVEVTKEQLSEDSSIPISRQKTYQMSSAVIATFPSNDGEKTMNVSISIVIGVDTEHEDFEDVDTLLTGDSAMTVIKDRISGLLATKDYEYMDQKDLQKQLRDELLVLVREQIGTEAVVEIYFPDGILKSIK